MGSYENIVKIEEMRRRAEEGDLLSAQKILDTMEIKKIKNMVDLNLMAEVYAVNERYDEATELYLKIYDKTKTRKSLFQLIEILINSNHADSEQYLMQYQKLAPRDFYNYVFRYKIDKLKGESYEKLIETLETLKRTEYTEQWAYELAKVYYKAGMEAECIRECSDIILWFGEGAYVEKAKMLRSYYSGESDKERIMEELKRRTEETNQEEEQEDSGNQMIALEDNQKEELEDPEDFSESGEDIYSSNDFMEEQETVEFEDELKKNVQDILTNDREEALVNETLDTPTEEIYIKEEEQSIMPEYAPVQETKQQAEQEVEDAIYQLLQEEDMDEEDRKLSKIADELQINPEEIFGNFLHIKSIKKQLVKSLESILDDHTKTVQIIITGTVGSGKTTLAKDITMFLNKTGRLNSTKVAKIKAEKLNSIDVFEKRETLKDCCLVVENASELKRKTIERLLELSGYLQEDIAIIFEENKKNMNKLFREYPKLMDLFKNRIHLPQYTQEDLMGFAYACLRQQDYRLHPKAESMLQNKVYQIAKQSEQHRHLEQIYNLMQSAMNSADIRTGKQLSNLASQGRLKDVEILSILPEDFKN